MLIVYGRIDQCVCVCGGGGVYSNYVYILNQIQKQIMLPTCLMAHVCSYTRVSRVLSYSIFSDADSQISQMFKCSVLCFSCRTDVMDVVYISCKLQIKVSPSCCVLMNNELYIKACGNEL